jgi:hypothetical protein
LKIAIGAVEAEDCEMEEASEQQQAVTNSNTTTALPANEDGSDVDLPDLTMVTESGLAMEDEQEQGTDDESLEGQYPGKIMEDMDEVGSAEAMEGEEADRQRRLGVQLHVEPSAAVLTRVEAKQDKV